MKIILSSDVFVDGGSIPIEYSCDGKNISPPLSWSGIPEETASIALIMDDPDAPIGTFVHWVLFNIDPSQNNLPKAFSSSNSHPVDSIEGKNSFNMVGYGSPCPPSGSIHRYFFRLYALDKRLNLPSGSTRSEVEREMAGHILASGLLMGTYGR